MISLENVERSYKTGAGQTWVLRRIHLKIDAGEFITHPVRDREAGRRMLDQAQQLVAGRIFQGADERRMQGVEKARLLALEPASSHLDQNVRHLVLPNVFRSA